jgi:hypothetical protein
MTIVINSEYIYCSLQRISLLSQIRVGQSQFWYSTYETPETYTGCICSYSKTTTYTYQLPCTPCKMLVYILIIDNYRYRSACSFYAWLATPSSMLRWLAPACYCFLEYLHDRLHTVQGSTRTSPWPVEDDVRLYPWVSTLWRLEHIRSV